MVKPPGWFPKRGEVYSVNLEANKSRPAVVLSIDQINKFALDVCLVGITTVERITFRMRVPIEAGDGNLNSKSWAKCDQVTTLEKGLLKYPAIGTLYPTTLKKIEEQVRLCLGLS